MEELFTSSNGDFDIQKKHINGFGDYVITSGSANNGILGKTDVPAKVFPKNTFTVDMFGCAFYRHFQYKMVTHARVFSLKPKQSITDAQGLFIVSSLNFLSKEFSYENMCSWEKIKSKAIMLPQNNGDIDFDFIEFFIKELQVERVAKLEAERTIELNTCLKIAGLDDCELSLEEKEALEAKPNYMPFLLSSLFDSENGDVDIKKKDINNEGDIVITAGVANNGIAGKTSIKAKVFPKDTLTIDMFGNCFYRNFKYKMVTHARVFALLPKQPIPNKEVGLYYQTLLTKYSEIYSFSSMCSWGKIKDCFISLPVTDNNEIDFEYIKNYIRAIEKTAIQKLYNDKGAFIEKAKEIIAS